MSKRNRFDGVSLPDPQMELVGYELEQVFRVTHSMATIDISLERIIPNPLNQYEEDDVEDLAYAIRQHGLLQPLIVVEQGRDEYRLIGGHRRRRALILNRDLFAGPGYAACHVLSGVSEEEEEAAIVFANTQRVKTQKDITMEVAALRRLHTAKKKRGEDVEPLDRFIGSIMKLSDATVNRHVSLDKKLSPEAMRRYQEEKLSFDAAISLTSVPRDVQPDVLSRLEAEGAAFSRPNIMRAQKDIGAAASAARPAAKEPQVKREPAPPASKPVPQPAAAPSHVPAGQEVFITVSSGELAAFFDVEGMDETSLKRALMGMLSSLSPAAGV